MESEQSDNAVQHLAGYPVHLAGYPVQLPDQTLLREKEQLLAEKDKRNEDLKQDLWLIESKLSTIPEPVTQPVVKKSWQFWKK